MDDHHTRRPDGFPGESASAPAEFSGSTRPTEQFPTAGYPSDVHPSPPRGGGQHSGQPYGGPEPLAHEGGYPYGTRPAAPYGASVPQGHDPFVPQHLYVPPHQLAQPYPQGPYPQPGPYPPGPYPQQFAPLAQQTVFVNNGYPTKRVNHLLHLILTVLTAGLWLPVWIILALANS